MTKKEQLYKHAKESIGRSLTPMKQLKNYGYKSPVQTPDNYVLGGIIEMLEYLY